jgi:transketolase
LSSWSEVSLSIETAKLLKKKGHKVRVVSIYCDEILQQLSKKQVNDILYKSTNKIVAIEA